MSNNNSMTTLEHIQGQMAALQATVEQQQTEITRLRAAQSQTPAVEGQIVERSTSRRGVLKRLMLAAAGSAAAGTALITGGGAAQAATGSFRTIGFFAFPSGGTPTNLPAAAGLAGSSESNFGSTADDVAGVYGYSPTQIGVIGKSDSFYGVDGYSISAVGVRGTSDTGNGVVGISQTRTGVNGQSTDGNGGVISSINSVGLIASSVKATGLRALSAGDANSLALEAINANGIAVSGQSTQNYGAQFAGGKAAMRLLPSTTTFGEPTTGAHEAGEFFVDKLGRLYYCFGSGTPGHWKMIAGVINK